MLITGGAGFIGINTALHFLAGGTKVVILDNFSRIGSKDNIVWLKSIYSDKVRIIKSDICNDRKVLEQAVANAFAVIHLAGQVAVTKSVTNPRDDFERNALGTFNVLEAVRISKHKPALIYSSTNKVYGSLSGARVREGAKRYSFSNRPKGIAEDEPLDFHSPYGCSKGAADQYVRDYARIYNLNTVVLRQSCVYGPHQFGIEDQGWVAWFIIASNMGREISIYGNGKQVRDILYVSDLCELYEKLINNIKKVRGQVFNIGGGVDNTLSLLEFLPMLDNASYNFGKVRPGDQPIYISDISKAKRLLGWQPTVSPKEGIVKLKQWVEDNKTVLKRYL